MGTLHAINDITAGQEVTVSVLGDLCATKKMRAQVLVDERGIEACMCNACTGYIGASDGNRKKLHEVLVATEDQTLRPADALQCHRIVLDLVEREGLGSSLQLARWYVPLLLTLGCFTNLRIEACIVFGYRSAPGVVLRRHHRSLSKYWSRCASAWAQTILTIRRLLGSLNWRSLFLGNMLEEGPAVEPYCATSLRPGYGRSNTIE